MSRKTHDAVYVDKYQDRNGEEKKRYTNMGALFARDDGSMFLKLESIPVNFSGWVALYEPREKEQQAGKPAQQKQTGGASDPTDDIPFAPYNKRLHF